MALVSGCARGPAPEVALPTPEAAVVEAPPPSPAAPATRFEWTARSTRYELTARTAVRVVGDSVPTGVDTVTTRALVTLAFAGRGDMRTIAGTVSDAAIVAGTQLTPPGPVSRQPPRAVGFSGVVGPGVSAIALPPAAATDCASAAASLIAAARELVPPVPTELRVGDRWQDSVTTTSCRAGVQITSVARHEYRVDGMDSRMGRPAIRVQRTTALQVSGSGEQSRREVTVEGTGRGAATLWLDPAAGHLVELDATTTMLLRHVAGGRVATAEQNGTMRAVLRP